MERLTNSQLYEVSCKELAGPQDRHPECWLQCSQLSKVSSWTRKQEST